jgi:hypothetical protein
MLVLLIFNAFPSSLIFELFELFELLERDFFMNFIQWRVFYLRFFSCRKSGGLPQELSPFSLMIILGFRSVFFSGRRPKFIGRPYEMSIPCGQSATREHYSEKVS